MAATSFMHNRSMADVVLPPGLSALWGRRSPASRGPKPNLDAATIVETAIDIANAEGLESVSMARVAQTLGYTTMSLYRHVANKDELLQLMWNASARDLASARIDGDNWRERLTSWAMVQRAAIERNVWIVQMPMVTPPLAPSSVAWLERGMSLLDDTALDDVTKIRVLGLISQHALINVRLAFEEGQYHQRESEYETSYIALLRELVDEDTFPHLYRLAWNTEDESPAQAASDEAMDEFRFDLNLILNGVESLIAAAQ